MLTSLQLGGYFDRVAGLVFGSFTSCDARADGRSTEDVLEEFGRHLGIPVLIDAPFGHGPENDSFVLGADVQIRANALVWNPR
jgi:muramoyltetrapeptide carboxypeptidase